jgi:5'-3' exoribonuclease 2
VDCIEAQAMPSGDDGEDFVDTDLPNPNGVEFDNLYLDFNGIVHQCAHPEDAPVPETEDEMCMQMFRYVDRLFNIVRPRKLLFIGVDGVAPRAKMNQQRSRRFRSAKEAEDKEIEAKRIATEFREQGYNVPDTEEGGEWDSNVITPGTPFMEKMVEFLRYYIHYSQSTKAGWKNVAVIVSDSNTPGEGEHKIMEYIRLQRAQPGYNPDTHHVIQGLDADLIMLALASHEQYFSILRENVDQNKPAPSPALNLSTKRKHGQFDEKSEIVNVKQFQLLHVSILREYLEAEFQGTPQGGGVEYPQGYDKERVIDDFIFLCFLCGNDFLPHLPSLDIREGGIDTLLATYKRLMPSMGGYLTVRAARGCPSGLIDRFFQTSSKLFLCVAVCIGVQGAKRQCLRFPAR